MVAGNEAQKFLLALCRGSDNDQYTLALIFHTGLEINPVGPDIKITPGR